ncbi:MAG: TIGR00341 family protein [Mucinivorans sp.]
MEEEEEQQQKLVGQQIKSFFSSRFNLDEDKADQHEVVENIRRGVEFRGTNLWLLIFAIVVASVGLNVNSVAVIIGAMLISPLMGPIMGIGLSLGINDFELLKRSFKNFMFSVAVSLVASTLYFMITPISNAQSEILARTTPTIWDVLIATFGGLAGIVAQSRRDRTSTVIPGVAIATALMPPLCTAGFGLATGNWSYFGGAFYLFFINAVFIAFATYFIVRYLKYEKKHHVDPNRGRVVKRYMVIIITATLVPSVILAYGIVQRTIFETSANNYINEVFEFEKSRVVNSEIFYSSRGDGNSIEVIMFGEPLSKDVMEMAEGQLAKYGLRNTSLLIRQASTTDALESHTMQAVLRTNTQIIDEKNAEIKRLEDDLTRLSSDTLPSGAIAREIASLWSNVQGLTLAKSKMRTADGRATEEVLLCMIQTSEKVQISEEDNKKIKKWLAERTSTKNVKIIIETK